MKLSSNCGQGVWFDIQNVDVTMILKKTWSVFTVEIIDKSCLIFSYCTVVTMMLLGADVNSRDNNGNTPLHLTLFACPMTSMRPRLPLVSLVFPVVKPVSFMFFYFYEATTIKKIKFILMTSSDIHTFTLK